MRFPDELLEQVDAYLERIRQTVPGVTLTRADAIRSLVVLGLETAVRQGADAPRDVKPSR